MHGISLRARAKIHRSQVSSAFPIRKIRDKYLPLKASSPPGAAHLSG
jgi:hypothetical protein